MFRVGVKYCGGCNPGYDRVERTQRIQALLKNRFIFSTHNQKDLDILVYVNGCPRACADKNSNHPEVPSQSLTEENDFIGLINWLETLEEKGVP